MAVGASLLTSGSSNVTQSSYTTASVTPSANDLILVWITSNSSLPSSLSGNGLTWVQVATETTVNFSAVYRSMGASPSAGAITIDFGGTNQSAICWVVIDYDTVDTSGTNGSGALVQSVSNNAGSGTSLTVTLSSAIGSGNATAAAIGHGTVQAQTAGSGYTKLGTSSDSGTIGEYDHEWAAAGTTTPSMSWSTSDVCWGIAVEVKISAGAALTPAVPQSYLLPLFLAGQRAENGRYTVSRD